MVKTCSKCKEEKHYSEFSKGNNKDGYRSQCKSCEKAWREANKDKKRSYDKAYKEANKEKIKAYYEANKDKIIAQQKVYQEANKEKKKAYHKAYREANKEKRKAYYEANKDRIKPYYKAYREANKEKRKAQNKAWREANKERQNEYQKDYYKKRIKTDTLFKLKVNLRSRTSIAFRSKGYSKNTKTQEMLGVDWEVAKKHIERQFKKGMNWNNYGEWHIDHIIPLSSAKTEERLKRLCHYTNLQPLWAEDNLSKSNSIHNQQTLLRI